MRTADGIALMNYESSRRIAAMHGALMRNVYEALDRLAYVYCYDLPRVNTDAEVWTESHHENSSQGER